MTPVATPLFSTGKDNEEYTTATLSKEHANKPLAISHSMHSPASEDSSTASIEIEHKTSSEKDDNASTIHSPIVQALDKRTSDVHSETSSHVISPSKGPEEHPKRNPETEQVMQQQPTIDHDTLDKPNSSSVVVSDEVLQHPASSQLSSPVSVNGSTASPTVATIRPASQSEPKASSIDTSTVLSLDSKPSIKTTSPANAKAGLPSLPSTASTINITSGSATIFIQEAIKRFNENREVKKITVLKDATTKAEARPTDEQAVFQMLRIACLSKVPSVQITALDCIGKLVQFGFFSADGTVDLPPQPSTPSATSGVLSWMSSAPKRTEEKVEAQDDWQTGDAKFALDWVVDSACACFDGDLTDDKVLQQILKALLSAVSSPSTPLHGPSLLQAIRTTYNVYQTLKSPVVAGGILVQMTKTVFNRLRDTIAIKKGVPVDDTDFDLLVDDANKVLKVYCRLSSRTGESTLVGAQLAAFYKNKIASLALLINILENYMTLLVSIPKIFVGGVKDNLWFALNRNAVSLVPGVYELALEGFVKVFTGMRESLKKELEIFINSIFLPSLENREITYSQKIAFLSVTERLCKDPQVLVEIYLNYDCDKDAICNIYERIVDSLSKMAQARPGQLLDPLTSSAQNTVVVAIPAGLNPTNNFLIPTLVNPLERDYAIKRCALAALAAILKSLVIWSNKIQSIPANDDQSALSPATTTAATITANPFATAKHLKEALKEGIRKFNFKPKKGIEFLLQTGGLASKEPIEIARFFRETEGLDKKVLGEFMGEGEEWNIAVMHAFVDGMDFTDTSFVDALRGFLQSFRLPGEAQKIDRYMLKFAEKYVKGNPTTFANADTAYVLAYSTVMLNTDQHNPQAAKSRMVKADFVKNNKGINDGADIPIEILHGIFDEIHNNEIVLKDEQPALGNQEILTAKQRKEAAIIAAEDLAKRSEALYKGMLKGPKTKKGVDGTFHTAISSGHSKAMFENAWMSMLTGLSGPLSEFEHDEVIQTVLEGFRAAVQISGVYDLDLEKSAFIGTLAKNTFLSNVAEMKLKHTRVVKVLLELAISDGNNLRTSWEDILRCVSQLEKFQLVSSGALNEAELRVPRGSAQRRGSGGARTEKLVYSEDVAIEVNSQSMSIAMDKIYSNSANLSGLAIVDFVKYLSIISWEEIQNSPHSETPRMYSLQKSVEITQYNMGRIRLEWSNIWAVLGEHFNQVGCHSNYNVASFAIDSLRQLSMKFLEKEELSNFKFQKEFLKPFEHILVNNTSTKIKDLVLRCVSQMLQARAQNFRSGWKTFFAILLKAAKEQEENVVTMASELMKTITTNYFLDIVRNGTLQDFISCLVEFAKNKRFAKTSLSAVELLKQCVAKISENITTLTASNAITENTSNSIEDPALKYWFPVYFGLYEITMSSELEVRTRALNYLFEALQTYGATYTRDFWDVIARESRSFDNREDMTVWLSTTLIQALRNLINLFSHYFEKLAFLADGLLELLSTCINQENETLARIGSTCLQDFIEKNIERLDEITCDKICKAFTTLFEVTTPYALFDVPYLESASNNVNEAMPGVRTRRREFAQLITKSVLQLLLIGTLHEILSENGHVYEHLKTVHVMKLLKCLESSYMFARRFNANLEVRHALHNIGFMRQLPNLLKQEATSIECYLSVLIRLLRDRRLEEPELIKEVEIDLVRISYEVVIQYNALTSEQKRNLQTWRPVILQILDAVADMDDERFNRDIKVFYDAFCGVLAHESSPEIQLALLRILRRCGTLFGIKDEHFLENKIIRDNEQDEQDAQHLQLALNRIKEASPTSTPAPTTPP